MKGIDYPNYTEIFYWVGWENLMNIEFKFVWWFIVNYCQICIFIFQIFTLKLIYLIRAWNQIQSPLSYTEIFYKIIAWLNVRYQCVHNSTIQIINLTPWRSNIENMWFFKNRCWKQIAKKYYCILLLISEKKEISQLAPPKTFHLSDTYSKNLIS